MAYAATPAATPAADAPATAEEAKAPPTIDSHGGKLSPLTSSYLPPTGSFLILIAILSVLAPRRLKAFGGVDLTWTRLVPGLLLTAVAAWSLLPSPQPYMTASLEHYLWVTGLVTGAMLAFTFLNLLADALFPLHEPSASRSLLAMATSGLALLIPLGLSMVDWWGMGPDPTISLNPMAAIIALAGAPLGLWLLLLWRRFKGWLFELIAAFGILGVLMLLGWLLPLGEKMPNVLLTLVALTVATTVGLGLRGLGRPGWEDLSGRVMWAWAWILRAVLVATSVAVATF